MNMAHPRPSLPEYITCFPLKTTLCFDFGLYICLPQLHTCSSKGNNTTDVTHYLALCFVCYIQTEEILQIKFVCLKMVCDILLHDRPFLRKILKFDLFYIGIVWLKIKSKFSLFMLTTK